MRGKKAFFISKNVFYQFTFWFGQKRKNQFLFTKKLCNKYVHQEIPYIRNEDPNVKNLIIDIVNNRSNLRKFLLATSDYRKNIQENINAVVADGKFNQAIICRAPDQKIKRVFELPIPLSVTFKDAKRI